MPDVIVIGGGIVGCLLASALLDHEPDASVLLLERDTVGGGASSRSAGLHFPRGATARVRAMAAHSHDFYLRLRERLPSAPIRDLDLVVLGTDPGAVTTAYLDRARLTRLPSAPGPWRPPPGTAAWAGTGCHHTDVRALARLLVRPRPRLEVREGVGVTGLRPRGGAVEVALGTGGTVTAPRVVLAPGPWVHDPAWGGLLDPLGVRVKKVAALHVAGPPAPADPLVVLHDEDAFLLPLAEEGRWLFSHTSQDWDVDPWTVHTGLSEADLAEARAALARHRPDLAARARSGRVFCDAYSPAREPLVTPVDPDGRIVFAGAANGSGYRLAPAIAAEVLALLSAAPNRHWSTA